MKRFIKAMSYTFKCNLGWKDRLVRAVIALGILGAYFLGIIPGVVGTVLAIVSGMLLATAVVSRCSIMYMLDKSSVDAKERAALDAKGIPYEV